MEKIIGTTEERLNRFMSMCLEWQRDLRSRVYRPSSYYFTNYHIGKVKKELVGDLKNAVIDRDWAIDKMNGISFYRAENEIKNGSKAQNRTIYTKTNRKIVSAQRLNLLFEKPEKEITKSSKNNDEKTVKLINEMLSLGYKVTLEKKI